MKRALREYLEKRDVNEIRVETPDMFGFVPNK